MSRINTKVEKNYTHKGAVASHINPEQQLRRYVLACMLWENTFYEDGISVADRIENIISLVKPEKVAEIAIEAREKMNLRHVPLLIARIMAKLDTHKHLVKDTLYRIIQRPDELTEFLAIYWKNGKQPISSQVKKGLALAFTKFNEYQLAKYNKNNIIKLKDILFLCHAKPIDNNQADLWKRLINNNLEVPDTWEVGLATGKDKKETWERLLKENKLGGLALLKNLRNMQQVTVDEELIKNSLLSMNTGRILPFRFISAAKHAVDFEEYIEKALFKSFDNRQKLPGKTIFIVDVSGSMYGENITANSELNRVNSACALALIAREQCEDVKIYATAGNDSTRIHKTEKVPPRRGFALSDAIYGLCKPLGGGGIFLKQVMDYVYENEKSADRIIVITDEQDCDNSASGSPSKANAFGKYNYILNVNTYKNGIAYDKWHHINGFSAAVLDYIYEYENI